MEQWLNQTIPQFNKLKSEFLTHQPILSRYNEILTKDLQSDIKSAKEKKSTDTTKATQIFEREKNKILEQFNELMESVDTRSANLIDLEMKIRKNLSLVSKGSTSKDEEILALISKISGETKVQMEKVITIRRGFSTTFRQLTDSASLSTLKSFFEETENLKLQLNQFIKTMLEINHKLEIEIAQEKEKIRISQITTTSPPAKSERKEDDKKDVKKIESISQVASSSVSKLEKSAEVKAVSRSTRIRELLDHVFQMLITNGHIFLEHQAEETNLSVKERDSIHDIQHFSSLYCLLRISDALKKLQRHLNFPDTLAIDSLIEFSNMLSKRGTGIVSFEVAMTTAEQICKRLPEQIRQIKRHYLNRSALTEDQLKGLVSLFGISENPGKYLLNPTIPVVEELDLFKMLQTYHMKIETTDILESDLHRIIFDVCVPKIKNIIDSIRKIYPNAESAKREYSKFNESYYLHVLALKMLLFICGSFCSEKDCSDRKKLARKKRISSKSQHIKLYNFLSHCCVLIRNTVRHEFPNDCRLEDIYDACHLSECLTEKPSGFLFAEKSKLSPNLAQASAKLGFLGEAKKQRKAKSAEEEYDILIKNL